MVYSCKKNLFILTLKWCQLKEWSLWLLKGALRTVWKQQISSFWCTSGSSRDQIQGLLHASKLLYQWTTPPKLYSIEETSSSKELSWDILVFLLCHISLPLAGKLSFTTALSPRQPSLSWRDGRRMEYIPRHPLFSFSSGLNKNSGSTDYQVSSGVLFSSVRWR